MISKNYLRVLLFIATVSVLNVLEANAQVSYLSTFDHINVPQDSFLNGEEPVDGYYSGQAFFPNSYDSTYKSWSGWAISNRTDRLTSGFGNQYSTYAKGGAARATGNFIIGTGNPVMHWQSREEINGVFVCNTAYTALSMLNGDQFAKKFGGASGDDPDYLLMTAYGYASGDIKDSAKLYLADYRFSDNSKDYILDYWTYLDLSNFGTVDSVQFVLTSSDNGQWGMNTPNYFCLEDVNADYEPQRDALWVEGFDDGVLGPESYRNGSDGRGGFQIAGHFYPNSYDTTYKSWSGWALSSITDTTDYTFANQYSAIPSGGAKNSHTNGEEFIVSYGVQNVLFQPLDTVASAVVLKQELESQNGVWITNSTYAYHDMKNGSQFSKKFGGQDGTDKDYFRVLIEGWDPFGKSLGVDTFYLADFRFDDPSKDYIVNDWEYVQLQAFQYNTSVRTTFTLESSDTGEWGMNTPAYFCMDAVGKYATSTPKISNNNLIVYPNPASGHINIPLNDYDHAKVLNVSGQVVLEQEEGDRMNVSTLRPGIYFIVVEFEGQVYKGKFVAQ